MAAGTMVLGGRCGCVSCTGRLNETGRTPDKTWWLGQRNRDGRGYGSKKNPRK